MALTTPIIIVNFKTYETATGRNAVKLAKILDEVAREKNASISAAVSAVDIKEVSGAVSIPVLSEHIDPDSFGSHTGSILPETVKHAGAAGTLLNHSEKRLAPDVLEKSAGRAREAGLETIVCAEAAEEAEKLAALNPDFIAIEPPELIGGDISVTSADPGIITETVRNVKGISKDIKVLVGAGIKTGADIKKAIELGADGVLLASGITKAENPKEVLEEMAEGLR